MGSSEGAQGGLAKSHEAPMGSSEGSQEGLANGQPEIQIINGQEITVGRDVVGEDGKTHFDWNLKTCPKCGAGYYGVFCRECDFEE